MSQRFFRCRLCGLPHNEGTEVCPVNGMAIPSHSRSLIPAPLVSSVPPRAADERVTPELPVPRPPRLPSSHAPKAKLPLPRAPSTGYSARPPAAPTLDAGPDGSDPKRNEYGADSAEFLTGAIVDARYRVQNVIAEGGMGVVYEAVHLELGRRVALKALARKCAEDKVAIARFRNEARVAGGLGHPNIVEVFDMGTLADGAPYLVMERLEGETLGQRIRRERVLPIDDAVQVMLQILSALAATHERGIMHRDLKPENVFLSRRSGLAPVVKLLDYGISKIIEHTDEETGNTLTRIGFVMGTPAYMAPEQARGERDMDGRVDLYAVGVLAYEMLLGRPPYVSKSPAALIMEMSQKKPAQPRRLRPEIPPKLEAVVMQLLSLEREDRFASAGEALLALTTSTSGDDHVDDADPTLVDDRVTARRLTTPGADADTSQKVQVFTRPGRNK